MASGEMLVERLSHRPFDIDGGMIRVREPLPKPSQVCPASSSSLVGTLDTLPPEVLDSVLDWLDFQSLCRFSLASARAHRLVQGLPSHRDVVLHAPSALAVLARTQVIGQHSAGRLRAVLRSPGCAWCGRFGAYLFLPTCERCCWDCLENNQSLWVQPRGVAARCFGLPPAQLEREVPTMLSLPGEYFVGGFSRLHEARQKLVAVVTVKRLALEVHGSEEKMGRLARELPRIAMKRLTLYKHYHRAPLPSKSQAQANAHAQAAGSDTSAADDRKAVQIAVTAKPQSAELDDPYAGMASVCFPSVAPDGKTTENGLWCKGCDYLFETYAMRFFPTHSGRLPLWTLFTSMRRRAFSRGEFLAHVQSCYGVQRVAATQPALGLEAWVRGIHDVDAPALTLSELLGLLLQPDPKSQLSPPPPPPQETNNRAQKDSE